MEAVCAVAAWRHGNVLRWFERMIQSGHFEDVDFTRRYSKLFAREMGVGMGYSMSWETNATQTCFWHGLLMSVALGHGGILCQEPNQQIRLMAKSYSWKGSLPLPSSMRIRQSFRSRSKAWCPANLIHPGSCRNITEGLTHPKFMQILFENVISTGLHLFFASQIQNSKPTFLTIED